jgi:hypothetical protein
MPGPDLDAGGDVPPKASIWQRLQLAMLKPAIEAKEPRPAVEGFGPDGPTTVTELEQAIKRADDKERLVGLIMAPIAGMIGLLVTGSLLSHDPSALLSNGQINRLHVSPGLYVELGAISVVLAVVMLVTAWFRKRLYMGLTMALYGLSIFNLHFWGFGVPYILAGAWYLVRAFRLQSKLKEAKAAEPGSTRPLTTGGPMAGPAGPNKRYTPPAPPPGRSPKSKPGKERKAG